MKRKLVLILLVIAFAISVAPHSSIEAAEVGGLDNGKVYMLRNASSGKYLNPHMGYDVDETNVYQWTYDGSVEQTFKLTYKENTDSYLISSMSSSNGNNRVLDIVKSSGSVVSGCNVQIYRPVDPVAQEWKIIYVSSGRYKIVPR